MKVSSITVTDLIGRSVANANGAEFLVADVRYDLDRDEMSVWIQDLDPMTGEPLPNTESGLLTLKGWTVL